ncbi:MAG: Eco57I restriction-modification methylase domain-containing protein [Alphaproteobacteria bacterium]
MTLFHKKLIQRELEKTSATPSKEHATILQEWAETIKSGKIFREKETAIRSQFVNKILVEVLGYNAFGGKNTQTLAEEEQMGKGSVDVALGHFTEGERKILAPFELKGAKTKDLDAIMAGRHKSPVQQAWEYAMDATGAKWVLVSNYTEIRLYAIGYGRQNYETWQLKDLTDPQEYTRFILFLSAENLLSGKTEELLKASDKVQKDITNKLYTDYKALRSKLIQHLTKDNPKIEPLEIITSAQAILDRVLFIAFAEDKGLLPEESIAKAYDHSNPYSDQHSVWDNFKGLFKAVDKGNKGLNIPAYNGGLFREEPALQKLHVSDELCEAFKDLADYDFDSEVSVTVLGHLFEQSISDLEELHAEARGEAGETHGRRKREGVVYTPDNITAFIVEKTLGGYLEKHFDDILTSHTKKTTTQTKQDEIPWKNKQSELHFWEAYQKLLRTVKVVDPACGSGAFLVAAFDYLHAEYSRVNDKLAELKGNYDLFDLDKEILNSNLYGVDINAEAVEITKLSLWLKTAKRGKILNSLDANIRVGDSLIEDSNFSFRAFTWKDAFPTVFEEGGFDVVLGNPPYVRQELIGHLKPYLQNRYEVYHGVIDLFAYFYEKGLRLLKTGGRLGYISSNTFFKTGSGESLRRYLSEKAALDIIVDFGDIQLFQGVTTYPTIMVMENAAPPKKHQIQTLNIKTAKLEEDITAVFAQQSVNLSQSHLTETAWQLESDALLALREKIVKGKKTLKEVYGSPLNGLKTALNDAFIIDKNMKDKLVEENPSSINIIKPYLSGREIQKWHSAREEKFVILFPKGFTIKNASSTGEQEALMWLEKNYKGIYEHLIPFEEKAKKRTDKGDFWWELRSNNYYHEFEKKKIVYPEISQGAKFIIDATNSYVDMTVFIMPSQDSFLLGLLNSKIAWFYLFDTCTNLRGGVWRLRLKRQFMNTIPIPKATAAQKDAIGTLAKSCQSLAEERYQIEENIRRRIPDLCPEDMDPKLNTKLKKWWTLDFDTFRKEVKKQFKTDIPLIERNDWETFLSTNATKTQDLTTKIQSLETQLNEKVYALYNLTQDEIMLVEGG